MACTLYEGLALNCNDGVGGAQQAWITEFASITASTTTSGTVTAITQAASTKFWLIDVPAENLSFTQSTAGTMNTPYATTQTVSFTYNKPTAKLRNWIATVVQNRFVIVIKDGNGTYQVIGLSRGAYVEKVDTASGKMLSDFSGSTFTFTAKEPSEAPYIASGTFTALNFGA